MSHDHNCAQPSTSRLLGTIDCKLRNFDKMKKKLFSKDKGGAIFVPSQTATDNVLPISRSTSQMEPQSSFLSPGSCVDHRRASAPSPQPMAPLSVLTFGGDETAGSGYDTWLQEDAQLMENESIIRAQEVGISMVRQRMQQSQAELNKARTDEHILSEFLVSAFRDHLEKDPRRLEIINAEIEQLEKELANLRELSPRCVPPERPPPPMVTQSWRCLRCAMESPMYEYCCSTCRFPRHSIDPKEALRCNCARCTQAVGKTERF